MYDFLFAFWNVNYFRKKRYGIIRLSTNSIWLVCWNSDTLWKLSILKLLEYLILYAWNYHTLHCTTIFAPSCIINLPRLCTYSVVSRSKKRNSVNFETRQQDNANTDIKIKYQNRPRYDWNRSSTSTNLDIPISGLLNNRWRKFTRTLIIPRVHCRETKLTG